MQSLLIAQEERYYVDSILNYLEYDSSVKSDDYELIDEVCKEAEEISISVRYAGGLFRSRLIQVQSYKDFADDKVELAISGLEKLLKSSYNDIPKESILEYYLVRGYICGKNGLFLEELNYYLRADSLLNDEEVDPTMQLYVDQHLAMYYFTQKEYDKARVIFDNIILGQEQLGIPNPPSYALYLFNLGVIYKHLGEMRNARQFMRKALDLGSSEYKDALFQYSMLAELYVNTNDLDSAEIYLTKAALLINDDNEVSVDLVDFYTVSSYYHFELKNYNSAISFASKAIQLSDSVNFLSGSIEAYKWRLKSQLAAHGLADCADDFLIFLKLNDSLINRSSLELEKKYLVQYQTLEKEALAKQAQVENMQLQMENALYKRSLLLYAIISIVLVFIAFLAIRRSRLKKKLALQELAISQLEREKVQNTLKQKEKDLEGHIKLLHENSKKIEALKSESLKAKSLQQIQEIFENNYIEENQWDSIILQFESIHPEFMDELRSGDQDFTRNDIKIGILLKLGFSNQGMQEILNISYEGVKKARQRFNRKRQGDT